MHPCTVCRHLFYSLSFSLNVLMGVVGVFFSSIDGFDRLWASNDTIKVLWNGVEAITFTTLRRLAEISFLMAKRSISMEFLSRGWAARWGVGEIGKKRFQRCANNNAYFWLLERSRVGCWTESSKQASGWDWFFLLNMFRLFRVIDRQLGWLHIFGSN